MNRAAQAQTTTTFVSNTGESRGSANGSILAQSFTAGSNPDGYTLSDVALIYFSEPSGADFTVTRVKIRKDNAGAPGDLVANLLNPASFSAGILSFAAPANTTLQTGETYWVVINEGYDSSGNRLRFLTTPSDDQTVTTEDPNWFIADTRLWKNNAGQDWTSSATVVMFAVNGTEGGGDTPPPPSTDATLSGLSLGTGVTLDPIFAPGTLTYAVAVGNAVDEVTVTPTTTHTNATPEFLDASDTALDDADDVANGHQVALAVGDTVIKVKVTAEDTTATLTYTVTVTRAAADTPPDAPTDFTATVGDAQVALGWKAPGLDSGVTGHEFRYKTDGDYPEDWTAIANSAPDEANENAFTVTGLTNEVAHTFELRAVNTAGGGAAATAGPVTPTPGICDRTQQIQVAILAPLSDVDDCAAVTVANLASITTFGSFGNNTANQGITSLQKGDFAGLTALTYLNLNENALDSLPGTVFSGLTALTNLLLQNNALDSLPEGLFSGLTALTYLTMGGNPTDPLPLTVTVEKVGTDQVRAKVLAGAPFAVDIPVTLVNGTLAGSATALSVAAGAVDGTAVTVTRTAGTTAAVTVDVDLTTPPTLPANHRGYEFVKATTNLPATILAADTPTCTLNTGDIWCGVVTPASHLVDGVAFAHGFVDDTPDTGALSDKEFSVVTDGVTNSYTIVAVAIGVGNATGSLSFSLTSGLTAADAAKLVLHVDGSSDQFAFSVSRNPYVWPRTDLDWSSGDPVTLRLRDTAAATPPDAPTGFTATVGDAQVALAWKAARLYSGVTGHEFRYKTDGDYPEDWTAIAYSGPDEANENAFTVTGLTNEVAHTFELRAVNAAGGGDAATAGPVTPTPGICDRTQKIQDAILAEISDVDDCAAVTVANLASITTFGSFGFGTFNQGITSLQKGDFAGLTSLTILNLGNNGLTSLPEGIFSGLAELANLNLSNNQLESLPAGAFDGLVKLDQISLSSNLLTGVPEGAFSGLTALQILFMANNNLSSLPEDLFSGLTALYILGLNENDLSSLPEDLFSGLTALDTLYLQENALDSLPGTVFSGLTALTRLELQDNALSSLPDGVFSDLTALNSLELYNNALDSLPEGLFSGLTALTRLELNNNALDSLPDGVFSGLTALNELFLGGNPTDPLPLTVTVEKVGTNQVRAKVLAGAPFAVDIPVTLVNGTLAGSATALSVAAGSVEGTAVTVTRTAGTTMAVTVDVDLTTQPTLPSGHRGYIFKKATTNLPATILPDATLSALSLGTGVTLDPTFAPGTTSYTAAVGNAVDEVTVTATTTDTNATPEFLNASDTTLDDADDVADGHQVALAVGDTVFKVQVTAEDGTTTQTYTVTVTRAAQAQEADVLVSNIDQPVASGSVEISSFDIVQGFMTGASPSGNFALTSVNLKFAGGGTSPVVTVVTDNSGQPGSLHATLVPLASVVAGDNMFTAPPGTTLDAGTPYFLAISGGTGLPGLAYTSSADEVSDTDADDWTIANFSRYRSIGATGDYDRQSGAVLLIRVNGTVAGDTPPPPSTDATLSALAVNDGSTDLTLDPAFAPGTTSYTAAVGNAVDEVTVTATTTDTSATIEFLDGDDATLDDADDVPANGHQVALAVGDTVFKVQVTAEDGTTTQTYTVTVTRAAAGTPTTCTLNTGDIWCGVVTPASHLVDGVAFGHGFVDDTPDTGALSDKEFSVVTDSVTNSYTIVAVVVGVGNA